MSRDRDPRDETLSERDRSGEEAAARRPDDPHDVFVRDLELPEGPKRERVGTYKLRGSETRILAVVGAFRAVPQEDLERSSQATRSLSKDVERLRQAELLTSRPYMTGRDRCTLLTLTERGHSLLENSRRREPGTGRQLYYPGPGKHRELAHDSRLYQAYRDAERSLAQDGCRVSRVRLESELKREYQQFLQEPNRRRRDATGEPVRDRDAILRWAEQHGLPVIDDSVKFPDLRVEYERPDGERRHEDIEVITPNYRGAHVSGKVAAGFTCYRYGSARIGGARASNRSGRARDARLAEEMLN